MIVLEHVLNRLAEIASEKTWPKPNLTQDEIYDILVGNIRKTLKYDKIDSALIESKRLNDQKYVNVVTARRIVKTDKNLQKFFFDDDLRLCCPQNNEDEWKEAILHYSSLVKDQQNEEYSDEFGWATDESNSNDGDCWDYIIPEITTTKNIVKDFFF